ncbi:MAG: hypothetical protein KJN81_05785 [Acidimicrobiia bacterium]|nr:hypothetical protein [Acidimicrobiia bacterium]NND13933.1 hypothetical protein [Acidimicrobiia bacterium]NNL27924.1 hypothetical protein [Acidimicrobiia bacterium]
MKQLLERVDRRTWLGIALAATAALLTLSISKPAPTVDVIFAGEDLPAGVRLADLTLVTRQMPASFGMLNEQDLDAVGEWTLAEPIGQDEPILPSLLRAPALAENPDLFALAVDPSHAVLGRISAGDYVDVYVTWRDDDITTRIAEGLYVVEARTDDDGFGDGEVQMLLAVDRDSAERLTHAVRTGDVDIVKRAP